MRAFARPPPRSIDVIADPKRPACFGRAGRALSRKHAILISASRGRPLSGRPTLGAAGVAKKSIAARCFAAKTQARWARVKSAPQSGGRQTRRRRRPSTIDDRRPRQGIRPKITHTRTYRRTHTQSRTTRTKSGHNTGGCGNAGSALTPAGLTPIDFCSSLARPPSRAGPPAQADSRH